MLLPSLLKMLMFNFTAKSGLEGIALQCLCTLLVEVTHFNFRVNIMNTIVARLSKKSWDEVLWSFSSYFEPHLTLCCAGIKSLPGQRHFCVPRG